MPLSAWLLRDINYSHSVNPDANSQTHSHLNPSRHRFHSLMDKLHIIQDSWPKHDNSVISFTHPHFVPSLDDLLYCAEHKRKYSVDVCNQIDRLTKNVLRTLTNVLARFSQSCKQTLIERSIKVVTKTLAQNRYSYIIHGKKFWNVLVGHLTVFKRFYLLLVSKRSEKHSKVTFPLCSKKYVFIT